VRKCQRGVLGCDLIMEVGFQMVALTVRTSWERACSLHKNSAGRRARTQPAQSSSIQTHVAGTVVFQYTLSPGRRIKTGGSYVVLPDV
jgi:hypothetical protein